MPFEVEAKIKVDAHEAIQARLAALGARRLGSVLEKNAIFDDPSGSLFKRDCGLRVRTCRHNDGRSSATLTFKGPQQPGPLKRRQEIELAITESAAARELLRGLGYLEVLGFEKRRETWELQPSEDRQKSPSASAPCRVELDELPHLGRFVEIEGPSEAAIEDARASLGLSDHPLIRATYVALLLDHCSALGLPPADIAFER